MSKTLRIRLRKPPGLFILADAHVWAEYLREGFSRSISLDGNGQRHSYPRTMAWLPDPSLPRSVALALARIFVAIDAKLQGRSLPPKGWIIRPRNGNTLDLRIKNLEVVPAAPTRSRNSFYAYWTVDHRWDIVEGGGDPKAVFAANRREFRATHKAAIKRDPRSPSPPAPQPRKKTRRGKP